MILTYAAYICGALALVRYLSALHAGSLFLARANVRFIPKGPTPPISLLKPLYGAEDGLEDNLIATLRQNYPEFEVLFLHEREGDPALSAVDAALAAVPDVEARTISGRAEDATNPKVAVLIRGEEEARHDIIVAADSDVVPDPLYLRDVANGLIDADAVSFVPMLFGAKTFWAQAISLFVNTDGYATGVVANGRLMTGATIAVKRDALEAIGGYHAVASHIADDYSLGQALRRAGKRIALARRPVRVRAGAGGLAWVVRWLRTVRSTAPLLYVLWLPTAIAPLLLLLTFDAWSLGCLAALTVMRLSFAVIHDFRFLWDRSLIRSLWLLPVLWLLEPCWWLAGMCGNHITWRGRRYRLKGGRAKVVAP